MMRMITVMATENLGTDVMLEAYKINPEQVVSLRQLDSHRVRLNDGNIHSFLSPICEITLPTGRLFASGVVDEILARGR